MVCSRAIHRTSRGAIMPVAFGRVRRKTEPTGPGSEAVVIS